ncbi:MAG TPA: hypothetical protein VN088_19110 [Nocardioides sp.]|nr:hypothetical protein [Nocardioides sp.]
MSGTVVQNTVTNPGGQPFARGNVHIELVTGVVNGAGYIAAGDIIDRFTTQTDKSGAWTATLAPNSSITPANTYYRVTEGSAVSLIVVPDSGGPYLLGNLLATPPPTPDAPGITGVQVAVGGTVQGSRPQVNLIAGDGMQIAGADSPSGDRVDITLTSTGGASPATTVVAEQAYGLEPMVGAASSFAREDHTHGTPALADTAATGSAPGDSAEVGVADVPARADHVHGREGYGQVTALDSFDTAPGDGTASTSARSDHVHGAPALPQGTTAAPGLLQLDGTAADIQALGTQAAGSSGKAADGRHVHPMTGIHSRQILILCSGLPSTVTPPVGTWTPSYLTNAGTGNYVGWVNTSDGAQNDAISFDFVSGAGTYSLELYYLPFTNRGIYTVSVDGVTVGTVDGYLASLSPQRAVLTGIALTAGQHTVTLTMATKNASSSGYIGMVDRIMLTRTA